MGASAASSGVFSGILREQYLSCSVDDNKFVFYDPAQCAPGVATSALYSSYFLGTAAHLIGRVFCLVQFQLFSNGLIEVDVQFTAEE